MKVGIQKEKFFFMLESQGIFTCKYRHLLKPWQKSECALKKESQVNVHLRAFIVFIDLLTSALALSTQIFL